MDNDKRASALINVPYLTEANRPKYSTEPWNEMIRDFFCTTLQGRAWACPLVSPVWQSIGKKTYTAFFFTFHFHQCRIYELINNTNMVINYLLRCWRARNQMLLSRFVFERDGKEHSSMLLPTMFAVKLSRVSNTASAIAISLIATETFDRRPAIAFTPAYFVFQTTLCFCTLPPVTFQKSSWQTEEQRKERATSVTPQVMRWIKQVKRWLLFWFIHLGFQQKQNGKNDLSNIFEAKCVYFFSWQASEIWALVSLAT